MPTYPELVALELTRNEKGRPNLYEDVQQHLAADRMLQDVRGMSTKLEANFDKWDANSDGVVTPIELEDFAINKANSREDRTAAITVRRAYHVLANMDSPNFNSSHLFIERSDVEGLGQYFDPTRRARAANDLWQKDYEAKMKTVENSNFFVRAATSLKFTYDGNPYKSTYENAAMGKQPFISHLARMVESKEFRVEFDSLFDESNLCTTKKKYGCFMY